MGDMFIKFLRYWVREMEITVPRNSFPHLTRSFKRKLCWVDEFQQQFLGCKRKVVEFRDFLNELKNFCNAATIIPSGASRRFAFILYVSVVIA